MNRGRITPIGCLLLLFFGVFLLYPLAYVVPAAASDQAYQVVVTAVPESPEVKAQVVAILAKQTQAGLLAIKLPFTVHTYPARSPAEELAKQLTRAGAKARVVAHRRWTSFYFVQALGFTVQRSSAFPYFSLSANSPFLLESLGNSLALAAITTLATTLLCLPLARWFTRYQFPGRGLLSGMLLVPLILPPFVGAIGLERFLERFGTVNLILMKLGLLAPDAPIDWLGGGGFVGVVLMQVLHLFPILYLNLAAAWSNIDPALEDAARNLGAGEWRVFRAVTFPLLLPGYFAGASIVFVWAFTDLGTPLVFNLRAVIPVQIYDQISDPQRTNSTAYVLVVITLAVTAILFYAARWAVSRGSYVGGGKGAVAAANPPAGKLLTALIYGVVAIVTFLAVLPNIGVVLTAFAGRWIFTPLPDAYTTAYWNEVWSNRVSALSIRNSISYSAASTLLDIAFGVTIAWLVSRRPGWLSSVLDGLATLPLALPGLVLAFGYLTCYSNWDLGPLRLLRPYLDPTINPVPLLVIAYAIRRLPYLTRSALAGLQQLSPILEEAAENLGATRWRVLRTVTLPLIGANLVAGAVLTFAFAVLEVSDSLMLAREEKYYPITRAILGLLMRPEAGDNVACALGVFAMGFLIVGLLVASVVLGRKMGELFRA